MASDLIPIIGEVPGWEGAYLCAGGGRKGILLGPGMGKVIADLINRRPLGNRLLGPSSPLDSPNPDTIAVSSPVIPTSSQNPSPWCGWVLLHIS